jgi:hypothetical protein
MKKLHLLSGMIALSAIAGINADIINAENFKKPGSITEEQRRKIEDVQWAKIQRQQQLARPAIYKMVDALIKEEYASGHIDEAGKFIEDTPYRVVVDWPAVFAILDKVPAIGVNEYATYGSSEPLLWIAVAQGNFLAAKTLLEKYKANPNFGQCTNDHADNEKCNRNRTLLVLAREKGDLTMAILLRQHGARM